MVALNVLRRSTDSFAKHSRQFRVAERNLMGSRVESLAFAFFEMVSFS